jgi:hypothetical protein
VEVRQNILDRFMPEAPPGAGRIRADMLPESEQNGVRDYSQSDVSFLFVINTGQAQMKNKYLLDKLHIGDALFDYLSLFGCVWLESGLLKIKPFSIDRLELQTSLANINMNSRPK